MTTAHAIMYAIYLLAKQKDVQDKLDQEVKGQDEITYETVMKMNYLDAVIQEVLRIYPPMTTMSYRKRMW